MRTLTLYDGQDRIVAVAEAPLSLWTFDEEAFVIRQARPIHTTAIRKGRAPFRVVLDEPAHVEWLVPSLPDTVQRGADLTILSLTIVLAS